MKTILIILIFQIFTVASAQESDPFNTIQWKGKDKVPWYEWWYYKVVLPKENEAFFMVYGVVNPWDYTNQLQSSRASVSFGDYGQRIQKEMTFPTSEFKAKKDQTFVEIADFIATNSYVRGEIIDEAGKHFYWDIDIKKDWAFNATGWATGKGITNIEWYPAQAGAKCSGQIQSDQRLWRFTDAPCYQDRNWGSSFPQWWTWIVSNHFENDEAILAVGGGKPKFFNLLSPIEGVAVGFYYNKKSYEFRPNDLDKVQIDISFGKWKVKAENYQNVIEIEAYAPKDQFMDLQFITPQGEIFHDYEALLGALTVKLFKKSLVGSKKLIREFKSKHAGIEFGSQDTYSLHRLFKEDQRIYSNY